MPNLRNTLDQDDMSLPPENEEELQQGFINYRHRVRAAVLAEEERLRQEAEARRLAQEAQEAEARRLEQEAQARRIEEENRRFLAEENDRWNAMRVVEVDRSTLGRLKDVYWRGFIQTYDEQGADEAYAQFREHARIVQERNSVTGENEYVKYVSSRRAFERELINYRVAFARFDQLVHRSQLGNAQPDDEVNERYEPYHARQLTFFPARTQVGRDINHFLPLGAQLEPEFNFESEAQKEGPHNGRAAVDMRNEVFRSRRYSI